MGGAIPKQVCLSNRRMVDVGKGSILKSTVCDNLTLPIMTQIFLFYNSEDLLLKDLEGKISQFIDI